MIAAGAVALLRGTADLPPFSFGEFSEVAVAAIAVMFVAALWVLWRRPAVDRHAAARAIARATAHCAASDRQASRGRTGSPHVRVHGAGAHSFR